MINGFIILIALQLFGEGVSTIFNLPIPGSVIGMVLLLIGLVVRGNVPQDLGSAADGLIKYIGLLFVPAGAGVSMYLGLIAEEWLMIVVASFTSTVLTLLTAAFIFKVLSKHDGETE